jgi:hypothetical protein
LKVYLWVLRIEVFGYGCKDLIEIDGNEGIVKIYKI